MIARKAQEMASMLWLPESERRDWGGFDADPIFSQRNQAGIRITPDTALQSTVVLACVRALAESVASLPLNLYEHEDDGGKKLAKGNPINHIISTAPNGFQTSYEWREQMMMHCLLWGNAYCEIKSGSRGFVDELIPLHPSRMMVEALPNGRLRYTYTEDAASPTVYSQDKIFHLRWMSDDGIHGMVPTTLSRDAIGLARACEVHGANFFSNGARPGVVLETDQVLEQEAAAALRDNWERLHRGSPNHHRTAVLMGGLKAHEFGTSHSESQFLETRRFEVEEICRIFRVPPHIVGDLTRSSFSNIEQQSIDFLNYTLNPWLSRIQAVIGRDIIQNDEFFAEFDPRGMLRGDVSARASYYNTMWQLGVTSINELRAWENLNPIPGGDQRFVQLNMQTIDQASANADLAIAQSEQAKSQLEKDMEEEDGSCDQCNDTSAPEGEQTVSQYSLNGGQITGIMTIVQQLFEGLIDEGAAHALIAASFPSIPSEMIDELIAGTAVKEEEPEQTSSAIGEDAEIFAEEDVEEDVEEEDEYEVVDIEPEAGDPEEEPEESDES